MWLEREAATVITDFEEHARIWNTWAPPATSDIGPHYANRQEAVGKAFHQDAVKRLLPLVHVSSL